MPLRRALAAALVLLAAGCGGHEETPTPGSEPVTEAAAPARGEAATPGGGEEAGAEPVPAGAVETGRPVWHATPGEPAHGLSMYDELHYPPGFTHFDYVNPDAPEGGTLRLAVSNATFDSLNPFILKGNPAAGIAAVYETLLAPSADEPFSEYGLLAETVQTPADRSWVAFELRPEARWWDGQPVTADDVIWTFHTLLEKGQPFFRFYYANVERVEKTGPRGVRFVFKSGTNRELPLIVGQLPVLPKHWWEGRDFGETSLDPPLGSGPYRVGRLEAGRFIEYQRVADYWGADLPVNRGRYNFDVMRYDYYRDDTVALEAFKGGNFDFRVEGQAKNWATEYDVPAVRSGKLVKEEAPNERPAGMQGFAMNLRRPLFQDPRVREAMSWAFDFEWSNRTLFYGQYTRTRSYFENSDLAARGLPGPDELALLEPYRGKVPEEVFTRAFEPPRTDGSGNNRANLRHAAELLAAAGWTVQDGKLVRDGQPFRFEILLVNPQFERVVLPYAKSLERLGIDASVRTVDSSQYQRRMDSFDFDMVVAAFPESDSPGNEQRDFWGSEAAKRQGSRNLIGIQDPVVDALVEKVISAPGRDGLVAACRALDRVLLWHHYVVPDWYIGVDRIAYWNKFGQPDVIPRQGVQIDTWWIDPKRAAALGGSPAAAP